MLRGQRGGIADRTKALSVKAAKSSDPASEVGSPHLETVREVKRNISLQMDNGLSQLWAKQGNGLHHQEAFRSYR